MFAFRRFLFSLVASGVAGCSSGGGGAPSSPGSSAASFTPSSPSASATPNATATPPASATPTTSAMPTATHVATTPSPTAPATAMPSPMPSPVATNGPALSIDASAGRRAISPDIYGVTIFWNANTPSSLATFAKDIALPVNRHGGDATTRYNWNVDATNAGSDFYFMAGNGRSPVTPGASVDAVVDGNRVNATKSIVTVPIIDYVDAGSATTCSYPDPPTSNQVSVNGNPPYNPYVTLPGGVQCGSGSDANGYIADTNPSATDVANSPSLQQPWIRHFVSKYGSAASGGVGIYELDNEPNGWIAVHHDVRPQNIGYTELLDKSIAMARAIKAADPTALVLGPGDIAPADENCNNGNPSNVTTGTCTSADDAGAHGNTPLGLWYLERFAAQSPRLLDYYSMHYPGSCCFSTNGTLADMVTAIERHKAWIAQAYPGTKLAYDEWNRGTGNGFANALATADGLGTMGQQGVDLASFWGLDDASYPSAFAFVMMRDYDGKNGSFGDTSIAAKSADPTKLTVYAAQRSTDGAVTIMVVNAATVAYTSAISVAGIVDSQAVSVFTYAATNPAAIVRAPSLAAGSGSIATFPPQSITMLVVPSGSTPLSSARPRR